MSLTDEFPLEEDVPLQPTDPTSPAPSSSQMKADPDRAEQARWQRSVELLLRYGLHAAAILFVALVAWTVHYYFVDERIQEVQIPQQAALAAPEVPLQAGTEQPDGPTVVLPLFNADGTFHLGIPRFAMLHTTIPSRPRVDVITYTVQSGDTVFGIAELFGLRPETIFWGNQAVLNDDPHRLFPDQVLNILPVDGVYHQWSAGENLERVAEFYGVDAQAILDYPGNHMEDFAFGGDNPEIAPGTMLIVPNGEREFVDFGPPRISRDNPAVASTYGPGHCGSIYDGAVGSGTFVWPTTERYLSGYDYNPAANHPGIDIAGDTGNPIYAADSGVVVYAGWSYFGYGNLVVIDHGEWQTLYAHLSEYYVSCGMSVFQGATIGAMGSTGNSSGSHLHFELMYQSAKVNPWDFLTP